MSQSATWDALQVARDARLWGATAWCEQILSEVAPDFAYMNRTHRRVVVRFWFDDGVDEYDDPYEVPTEAEQRAAWRERVRSIDWLSWWNPTTTSSVSSMLKEIYSENRITEMAMAPNPLLSFLRRNSNA